MIACYLENISDAELLVEGEPFIHLNSALRVREGDQVLAMDGIGGTRLTKVLSISKKKIILAEGEIEKSSRAIQLDVLLAPPKRDAFNDCLRFACEIGIANIYLYHSEYAQNKKFEEDRVNKILRSGIVQSNNPFMPKVTNLQKDLSPVKDYDGSFIFHLSENATDSKAIEIDSRKRYLLVMGPEGGFSNNDIEAFHANLNHTKEVFLNSPILRTPTALCVASGWVLSKI